MDSGQGHDMTHMQHAEMDHVKMGHTGTGHEDMGHGNMDDMKMDHGDMGHMGMGGMGHMGNLRRRFWVSLALAVPVLLLSPMMGVALPFQFSFPGSAWVVLALSFGLYFTGTGPFWRAPGMS